jgi:hypothetical protein
MQKQLLITPISDNSETQMSPTETDEYKDVFYVLGLVFIEIRATENLSKAQILADVFHNVPAMMNRRFTPEEIMAEIDRKSVRHGCGRMISALFETAAKRADGACSDFVNRT